MAQSVLATSETGTGPDPAPRRSSSSPRRRRRPSPAYAFVGLAVAYLLLFAGVPLLRGIQLSFTDTRLLNPSGGRGVGLENYRDLFGDGSAISAITLTLAYTALTVVASLVIGTLAAVLLNRAFPLRSLARALMTLPWAVPTVAVALVFRWMYNDSNGVLNSGLRRIGLDAQGWLTDPDRALFAVVLATVWKVTPFVMLVVLAALQSVPDELYEATRVDGADGLSTFRVIVLPAIAPTLKVVGLLMTIWSFRRFEIIWLLTGGGPAGSTNTIVIDVYREAFGNSDLGKAAAIGVVGLVLSLIVTVVYLVVERRAQRQLEER